MADDSLPLAEVRPEYYRDLAAKLRERSPSLLTAVSRRDMAELAAAYERLADLLERHRKAGEPARKK